MGQAGALSSTPHSCPGSMPPNYELLKRNHRFFVPFAGHRDSMNGLRRYHPKGLALCRSALRAPSSCDDKSEQPPRHATLDYRIERRTVLLGSLLGPVLQGAGAANGDTSFAQCICQGTYLFCISVFVYRMNQPICGRSFSLPVNLWKSSVLCRVPQYKTQGLLSAFDCLLNVTCNVFINCTIGR